MKRILLVGGALRVHKVKLEWSMDGLGKSFGIMWHNMCGIERKCVCKPKVGGRPHDPAGDILY